MVVCLIEVRQIRIMVVCLTHTMVELVATVASVLLSVTRPVLLNTWPVTKTTNDLVAKKTGNKMNELEYLLVHNDMTKQGYTDFTLQPGNDCIWASVSRGNGIWLDFYYIFRDGRIADIQID